MVLRKRPRLGAFQRAPAPMEYWTWGATSGNGCMMHSLRSILSMQPSRITMLFLQRSTRWALTRPSQNTAACAAAPGTGHLATVVLPIAYGLEKTIITMRSASVVRFQNKHQLLYGRIPSGSQELA